MAKLSLASKLLRQSADYAKWRYLMCYFLAAFLALAIVMQAYTVALVLQGLLDQSYNLHNLLAAGGWLFVRVTLANAISYLALGASHKIGNNLQQELLNRISQIKLTNQQPTDAQVATLIVEQVAMLDGYFARYKTQSVLAVLLPATILLIVGYLEPIAAAILLMSMLMLLLAMIVIGRRTAARSRAQLAQMSHLANRF